MRDDDFIRLWNEFCDPENTDMDRVRIARKFGDLKVTETKFDPQKSALEALREAA